MTRAPESYVVELVETLCDCVTIVRESYKADARDDQLKKRERKEARRMARALARVRDGLMASQVNQDGDLELYLTPDQSTLMSATVLSFVPCLEEMRRKGELEDYEEFSPERVERAVTLARALLGHGAPQGVQA